MTMLPVRLPPALFMQWPYDAVTEPWPISPPTGDPRDVRRYRSSTAPVRSTSYSPTRPHPPILTPGYVPSTIHKPDLFFGSKSPSTSPDLIRERSPPDPPQWPYDSYFGSQPPPPPPPPPPPVPSLPSSSPELPFPSYPNASPEPNATESPTDPAQLQQALALSRTESTRQAQFLEKLSSQEEEDLARALEESLGMNSYTSSGMRSYNAQPGSSTDRILASESTSIVRSESWQSQYSDDEAFARRLAAEEEERDASQSHLDDDEAFARHLAAQEEEEEAQFRSQAQSPAAGPSSISHTINSMDEELARKIAAEEELEKQRSADGGPLPLINAPSAPPAYNDAISPPLTSNSRSPSLSAADSSLMVESSLYRSNSAGSASSYYSSSEVPLPNSRPASADATLLGSNGQLPTIGSLSSVSEGTEEPQPTVGGNQFVDQELLRGVCTCSRALFNFSTDNLYSYRLRSSSNHTDATNHAGCDAKHYIPSLWAMSSSPLYGPQLAASIKADGAIVGYTGGADVRGTVGNQDRPTSTGSGPIYPGKRT